jgi:hypothetical protein
LKYGNTRFIENAWFTGPIRKTIDKTIDIHVGAVRELLESKEASATKEKVREYVRPQLLATVARILRGIQLYRHGGGVIITPDGHQDVAITYQIAYDRLRSLLISRAASLVLWSVAQREFSEVIESEQRMFAKTASEYVRLEQDREDTAEGITGAIRTIASMSRPDGVVVLDMALNTLGYGAMIALPRTAEPARVMSASDESGVNGLREIPKRQFGSRHLSLARYCYQHPESVGFVVSQDGVARAMKRVAEELVVWENIMIRRYSL